MKKSIDKLTVKEVCEHCSVNRETFYNHFTDIMDVFKFILHEELSKKIAQTFSTFIDKGAFAVASSYNKTPLFAFRFADLAVNIVVFAYMIYKVRKTKRNPYSGEIYTDLKEYKEIKELAEE